MNEIIDLIGDDLEMNDVQVTEWLNEMFDIDTDVFEFGFIVNQLCSALLSK